MLKQLTGLALLPLFAVLGCGSGSPVATPQNPILQTLPGNWQMQVESSLTAPVSFVFNLLGELSVEGSTLSGVFQIPYGAKNTPTCVTNAPQTISFSGALDENDLLTLTSAPFSGSVATLQLQIPVDGPSLQFAQGSISIVGGLCAYPATPVIGVLVPPLNGTYAGTFALQQFLAGEEVNGPAIPATITYTQSPANADGQFPLSAKLSLTSSSCTFSATITGIITGLSVEMFPGAPSYSSTALDATLQGAAPVTSTRLVEPLLDIGTSSTSCSQGFYAGSNFTLQ